MERGKIKWIPLCIDEISLKPFSLNFVFGPRQVGKTTLLKLLIKKLLEQGIEKERIFYFRCDKLADYKELDEVLKTYFEFRKSKKYFWLLYFS
jgi:predicted AAA+ superfamily ATPase